MEVQGRAATPDRQRAATARGEDTGESVARQGKGKWGEGRGWAAAGERESE